MTDNPALRNLERRGQAVVIGAGPAGLTAAYELTRRTGITPIVLEKEGRLGGLATSVDYRGNRLDIGPHRFFSKSDRVMRWWTDILPVATAATAPVITYRQERRTVPAAAVAAAAGDDEQVMLLRPRQTRIYFTGQLFRYPVQLSWDTLRKFGLRRIVRGGVSYLWSQARPIRPEANLEDFFINRFGRELYRTFFQSYTEKVWGVPCRELPADWGAQRVRGLSLTAALRHALVKLVPGRRPRRTETSLVEQFLYPKHGAGQMWETVAERVTASGGRILTGWTVSGLETEDGRVVAVEAVSRNGQRQTFPSDYVFSTMPIPDLTAALRPPVPETVAAVSRGLGYRHLVVVGLLARRLLLTERDGQPLRDNWLYLQDSGIRAGRLQICNNMSPALVADPETVWIGVEYFCGAGDDLWRAPDDDLRQLAVRELSSIGLLAAADVIDGTVIRAPQAYPAYLGTYPDLAVVRRYLGRLTNLSLLGRNGLHRYNNQDHSMLTAMVAVDNIVAGRTDQGNVWDVNTEESYHETKG